jgi:DNA-binding NtrC family response regulator
MKALHTYHWPGNVRELENFIERAVILTQGQELFVSLAELQPTPSHTTTSGTTSLNRPSANIFSRHCANRTGLSVVQGSLDEARNQADHPSIQDAETRHRTPILASSIHLTTFVVTRRHSGTCRIDGGPTSALPFSLACSRCASSKYS